MSTRIGITTHSYAGDGPDVQRETVHELRGRYLHAVAAAGGVPLLLPVRVGEAAPVEQALAAVDGLLLSGGGPIPDAYFQRNPHPSLRDTNPARYDYEVALVREARTRDMPVLGICRGMQTLVEAAGGTLIANLADAARPDPHVQRERPDVATHDLRVKVGSLLHATLGERTRSNTYHRQAVARLPVDLKATAWAHDGVVEAIEAPGGFTVGVQFHPEWLSDIPHQGFGRLFDRFVAAADAYARRGRT